MTDFLGTLDHLKFSVWVMQSNSVWSFPTFLFLHTLGMSIVAGLSAMIDLVLLGFWPKMPIRPLGRLYPLMWIGFWLNAATGTVMLIADATAKLTNWDFYVKMGFVFAGVAVLRVMQKKVFADPSLDKRAGEWKRERLGLGLVDLLVLCDYGWPVAGLHRSGVGVAGI